ncbi:MAG: phosphatase PAP2 family protein [Myxococcales bacterium]
MGNGRKITSWRPLPLDERLAQVRAAPRFFTVAIPAFCVVYCVVLRALSGLGPEHFVVCGLLLFFSLASDGTRRLARVVFPFLLYAVVYDSMRWYEDAIRSPVVHLREPYLFDLRFFGIREGDAVVTPNEWFQRHTSRILDFACGLAYTPLFFIGESVALALVLFFRGEIRRAERFVWIFVVANFVGFSIYYIYPAAPPWYVAAHGFVADFTVRASAAGALRFDQLVGLPIMAGFYGKSADVFGAIPSLHVVYPFLALVYGSRLRRFRLFALGYWLLVCFSAVYLDHHYILDLLIGFALALLVMGAFRLLFGPLPDRSAQPARLLDEPTASA